MSQGRGFNGISLQEIFGNTEPLKTIHTEDVFAKLPPYRRKRYGFKLMEWQEQQCSTAIIDNTLNRMVDSYMQISQLTSPEGLTLLDDAAFSSETVRDTAVWWAIAHHGLSSAPRTNDHSQHGATTSNSEWNKSNLGDDDDDDEDEDEDEDENDDDGDAGTSENKDEIVRQSTDEMEQNPNEHNEFIDFAVTAAISVRGLLSTPPKSNPNNSE